MNNQGHLEATKEDTFQSLTKPVDTFETTQGSYPTQTDPHTRKTNVILLLLLILLNLTFVLGPYIGIWGVLIGFFFASFGLILSGGLMSIISLSPSSLNAFVHIPAHFTYEPMGILALGVGICCIGLLLFLGTSYVCELCVKTTHHYLRWMKSLI